MRPFNWKLTCIAAFVCGALGYTTCHILLVNAMGIPQGMWGTAVLLALVTGILLYLGWGIRRRRTKPAKYQGKEALFTAYLAQSAAWTGAVLFGWYVGILLPLVIEVFHGDFLSYALWDTLTIIAALGLWCLPQVSSEGDSHCHWVLWCLR